jgi:molybdopterin-guanine dinucleotide biosynthesis protein A
MGRAKAWLPFGDEVMLQRVVRVLQVVVSPVIVVAAPEQDLPILPISVAVVRDERDFLGPLNGLAAGLAALAGRADVAYLSSCDVPFLTPGFIRTVVDALGEADACFPEVGGYLHPLAGAYRVGILPVLRDMIAAGQLRPSAIADRSPTRLLGETELRLVDPELRALRNVNTPDEYAAALREAGYDLPG